jgi:hypothetical protein
MIVNICSIVGRLQVCSILPMNEIEFLVNVTMIQIIGMILHSMFDNVGIQDPILEIV